MQKEFVIIAGVNGSGKSSYYQNALKELYNNYQYFNHDEKVKELGLDSQSEKDFVTAGKALLKEIKIAKEKNQSFIIETVLASLKYVKDIKELKAKNYKITMYYLCICSINQSAERVANRVAKGGHDVPLEKINSRFPRSFSNLQKFLPIVDNLNIVDNSFTEPRIIYKKENSKVMRVEKNLHEKIDMLFENLLNKKIY